MNGNREGPGPSTDCGSGIQVRLTWILGSKMIPGPSDVIGWVVPEHWECLNSSADADVQQ